MKTIRSKNAVAGMVLASDVSDVSGRLLVTKGTTLGDKHLKVFRTWGVPEISIECEHDVDEQPVANIPDEIIEKATRQVAAAFVHNDLKHELIREVHKLAVEKVALELMKEKTS